MFFQSVMTRSEKIRGILLAISPIAYIPFAQWISTTPVGTGFFIELELLFFLAFVFTVFAVPVLLFRLRDPVMRAKARFHLLLAAMYIPCCIGGLVLGHHVRMSGMRSFAARSQRLIAAIELYIADHGNPPQTLDDLVPDYLEEVPGTGMMAYPEYEYITDNDARQSYDGNPWVLTVHTPSGGINFDSMLYFPLQNYPKFGYGGGLRRIGNWAYVHE